MTRKANFTSQAFTEDDIDWKLCVPCVTISCASIEDAEAALTALAMLDDYCAGAITLLDGCENTAIAYLNGRIPNWPGIVRTWLSGRAARNLGLPNPLRRNTGEE